MNKKYAGYIIGAVVLLLVGWLVVTYNGLVNKEETVKLKWNEVQNAYQRRLSLIPNVVNVVKGGAEFEQTTLQQVVEARARATAVTVSTTDLSADQVQQQTKAQDELAAVTNRLLITVERYPELKGTAAFSGLQTQLEGTERRIKVARKNFNESIQAYNSSVKSFPTKIAAGLLGFKPKEGFTADAGSDKATEIKF